jgi:hypothetical protein
MTMFLAMAVWVGASAIFAPVIGHFLSSLQSVYPEPQPTRLSFVARSSAGRTFARRRAVQNSWTRKALVQSKFG